MHSNAKDSKFSPRPFFKRRGRGVRRLGLATVFVAVMAAGTGWTAERIFFLSTQLVPVGEAAKMRHHILSNFPRPVDFEPNDNRMVFEELATEAATDPVLPVLLGGLHGDFVALAKKGRLEPLDDILRRLENRYASKDLVRLGRFGGEQQIYLPWMQATYLMAANRRALKYLPPGADLDHLTYGQLGAWAARMAKATGSAKLGFPAGVKGLMHRFIQGYLYPSFTAGMVSRFASADARAMWKKFKKLWAWVHPRSLTYHQMSAPLLSNEVWLAWDHSARLLPAFERRPDDFVAFPAPVGPRGRGALIVLSGLAIPRGIPDRQAVADLIEYLTRAGVQIKTLKQTGFFPVVAMGDDSPLPPGLARMSRAVMAQTSDPATLKAMLPMGLGPLNEAFSSAYLLTFSQIVLNGEDIRKVLDRQADKLRAILSQAAVPCWPPDHADKIPCTVE